MPQYKTKPRFIEAYQFLAGPLDETKSYPQWLLDAIADGTIVFTEDDALEGTILNELHGSEINFKDTDWIIFNEKEDIYPCTDEEFQKRYEVV